MRVLLVFVLSLLLGAKALAAPRQIVIMRHADKLDQEETGPALSAKGMMRSIKFAYYYLNKFGEPDYIVSADAKRPNGREVAIRSLQTVAPLANMLAIRHPGTGFDISHPYASSDYELLAESLLEDDKYANKTVLVCWSHSRIPKLLRALGVEGDLDDWPKYDYDTLYVLQFSASGRVVDLKKLTNQFPINEKDSWDVLHHRLFEI